MEEKKRVPVYMTDEDRRSIKIEAGYADLSVSEFIRRAALEAARVAKEKR